MSFGYIGDTSTSVKQQVKNKGIITTQESFDLERQGFLGGSLELIETKDLTGTTPTTIDFTNLKEDIFDVHLIQFFNLQITGGLDTIRARVSNDGGSSYESTSSYDSNIQTMTTAGSFGESTRTNFDAFDRIGQNAVNVPYNGYIYIYNAGNSSRFTFISHHVTNQTDGFRYGGQAYEVAETVNAFRLFLTSHTIKDVGSVLKLYGVKQ